MSSNNVSFVFVLIVNILYVCTSSLNLIKCLSFACGDGDCECFETLSDNSPITCFESSSNSTLTYFDCICSSLNSLISFINDSFFLFNPLICNSY